MLQSFISLAFCFSSIFLPSPPLIIPRMMNWISKLGFISAKPSRVLNTNRICRNYSLPVEFEFDVDQELEKIKRMNPVEFYRGVFKEKIRVAFKIKNPKPPLFAEKYRTVIPKDKVFKIMELVYQCPPASDVLSVIGVLQNKLGIKELPVIRVTSIPALTETKRDYKEILSQVIFKKNTLPFPEYDGYPIDDELYEDAFAEREENDVCVGDGEIESIDGRQDYRENGVCLGDGVSNVESLSFESLRMLSLRNLHYFRRGNWSCKNI